MPAECTARVAYIVASERCVGTAAGLPIPAAAQNLIGTEPIRRGAAETDSGYAPQKSGSWLVQAAARRGRAAVSAVPPERPLLRSGFGCLCIVPQTKQGLGATALPGRRAQADAGDFRVPASPFPRAGAFGVRPLDPAVPCRSGNGAPASVCVSPRRSSCSGSAPPMRSSAFAPPIFCERCAAAPNAGFLRLAQADGGMAFTGRFSDAERSLSAPV